MSAKQIFETLGNVELLSQNRAAVFASKSAPPEIYPQAKQLVSVLCQLPIALAGGWQAPLEKMLLKEVYDGRNKTNVIHYLAKNINTFKPDKNHRRLLGENRLLFISPGIHESRPSVRQVKDRDELVFSQISKIIFIYISKGGRLQEYFERLISFSYQVFLLDHPLNKDFLNKDVVLLNADNCRLLLVT